MTAEDAINELPYGIGMKGGVAFVPESGGFVVIVHPVTMRIALVNQPNGSHRRSSQRRTPPCDTTGRQ